ncbi:MAG: anthranilate phosphoribosyltransferase [Candidatus Omnitrophica bacterium]|nr:anthranilate phosphoribosyltransferase [Candidatus Omnitrophota bacterium]
MENIIAKLKQKIGLTQDEMQDAMQEIMQGKASELDIENFLLLLRDKGLTRDEITGAALTLRRFMVPVTTKHKILLDTCGTGGDKKGTFNISTISAFVVAGCGVAVAKHGNRSISSKCGSACILEALGVNLDLKDEHLSACLDDVGIVFLFAQKLHPSMRIVAPIRKKLKVETIFNILGPLSNPAKATHQIMGVYSRDYVEALADVLKNLGLKKAMVVHGSDGLDEITTTGKTFIAEYNGEEVISYDITPDELGFDFAKPADLLGGDIEENLKIFKSILSGTPGPKRDIVLINAAYALYIAEKAKTLNEGLEMAKESIDSGKAAMKLQQLIEFTNRIEKVNSKVFDKGNAVNE